MILIFDTLILKLFIYIYIYIYRYVYKKNETFLTKKKSFDANTVRLSFLGT